MTERLDLICNVAVATVAGVGGIALCCAGGGCYGCFVAVARCGNDNLTGFLATLTGVNGVAVCGTGGIGRLGGFVVTERVYVICNVGVTAMAGVGGIALFGTGRSGYL